MEKLSKTVTDSLSDTELITRILAGEKELYSVLVRRYNERLYRVCMSMIKNDNEAEELMQVAYIKAYENLGSFVFQSAFSTWLTRILINECLQWLKKQKKSVAMDHYNLESAMNNGGSPKVRTPLMEAANAELRKVLEHAILALPEKYRAVFIMRELERMNVAETGDCLGISEVNVKVRLNRAKALLRNSLDAIYKKEELLSFHLLRCERVTVGVMERI